MSSYRLSDSYCIRAPLRSLYISAGALLAGIVIVVVIQAARPDTSPTDWPTNLIAIAVVATLGAVFAGRRYFRIRHALRSFPIILERDELTRIVIGLPEVTLFRDEVTEIVETTGAGVRVSAGDPARFIFVPAALLGNDHLRGTLASWHEITVRPSHRLQFWVSFAAFLALVGAAYTAVLFSMSLYVAVPAAALLFGFVSWCVWSIWHSPYLDPRTKRLCWFAYLPLIPAVLKLALLLGFLDWQ